ncbi:crotonase/enoyl-CoA hydratase family protein [Mycobacterium sp. DL592]|uniref:crotonase/enoyl-CoA hydratase family protein n=1 Tax=Mycobacterium sp. DL592 TaxID=2675524 RepID=UPI0014203ABA|nr:crotonase/enoyl-CoA hydratase family protein [Mycobacterium sp. DL592]
MSGVPEGRSEATREGVRIERNGPVTTVILDRPHARNAVDGPTALALRDAFEQFDNDDSASVAVLWGDNGTFCAGADLKAMGTADSNPLHRPRAGSDVAGRAAPGSDVAGRAAPGPMGPTRMVLSKPVIAAVSGYAVAGGLELALWCDMRVVEEDAVFGVFCRRWGVPLIDGGTVRLPRLIGHSRAMDLILTGRAVQADEALAIGLANRVVPAGHARQAAEELAAELAALPQGCLRSDRLSAIHQWGQSEAEAIDVEFGSLSRVAAESLAGAARFAKGEGRHGAKA